MEIIVGIIILALLNGLTSPKSRRGGGGRGTRGSGRDLDRALRKMNRVFRGRR